MAEERYCVYAIVNRDAGEVLVGISDRGSLATLKAAHKKYPPVWMAKWAPGSAEYEFVVCKISRAEAAAFAANYARGAAVRKLKAFLIG